jgi:hypothetical protein
MRIERHTLLAGVAALALVAGTAFASAQTENQQTGKPVAQPNAAMHHPTAPATGMQHTNNAATGNMKRPMQNESRNAAASEQNANRQAQHMQHTTPTHRMTPQDENREQRKRTATQEHHGQMEPRGMTREHRAQGPESRSNNERTGAGNEPNRSAEGNRGENYRGLQGNAAAESHVRLNEHQRTAIRNEVINAPGAPVAASVPFGVRVGTVFPTGFRIAPLPPMLVSIDPGWRGFEYFVYRHEIVVVNPMTLRIVAVLPV